MKKKTENFQSKFREAAQKAEVTKEVALDILIMTEHHLKQCKIATGEITDEDITYCKNLGLRMLDYVSKKEN